MNIKKIVSAAAAAVLSFTGTMGVTGVSVEEKSFDSETVSVIVTVKGDALLSGGEGAEMGADFLLTDRAEEMAADIAKDQERAFCYIKALYPETELGFSYNTLLNGFSCTLPEELIGEVKKCDLIEDAAVSQSHAMPELYEAREGGGVDGFSADTGYYGEGEVVAVLDTELDTSHDMFSPLYGKNVKLTYSGVGRIVRTVGMNVPVQADMVYVSTKLPYVCNYTDEGSRYDTYFPGSYHGTHVCGIAAGNEVEDNNGSDISGIAPDAQIIFMKVFAYDDVSGNNTVQDDVAAAAIEDAVKLGATVINMSFGASTGFSDNDVYSRVFESAENAGVTVVAAAGNDGSGELMTPENVDRTSINYPGSDPRAFTVASSDNGSWYSSHVGDAVSDFSSFGTSEDLRLKPDIMGVGGYVESADYYGGFAVESGTSMASPYISGCVALMSEYLKRTGDSHKGAEKVGHIKKLLMCSAVPFREDGLYISPRAQGSGLVNMENAVNAKVLMTGADGQAALSLGDGLSDSFDISLRIKNISNEKVSFSDASLELTTDDTEVYNGTAYIEGQQELKCSVTGLEGLKQLSAKQEKTVTLHVTLDSTQASELRKTFKNGFFADGFITLSGSPQSCDISVAMTGFCGSWADVPIFDEGLGATGVYTDIYMAEIPAEMSMAALIRAVDQIYIGMQLQFEGVPTDRPYYSDDPVEDLLRGKFGDAVDYVDKSYFENILREGIYISPDYDSMGDGLRILADTLRPAVIDGVSVYDSDGTFLHSGSDLEENIERDSPYYFFTNYIGDLPEGEYLASLKGYVPYDGAEDRPQYFEKSFTVDKTPPVINSARVTSSGGRKILTMQLSDSALEGLYVIGNGTGGVKGCDDLAGLDGTVIRDIVSAFSDSYYSDQQESLPSPMSFSDLFSPEYSSDMRNKYSFYDAVVLEGSSTVVEYDVTDLRDYIFFVSDRAYNSTSYGADVPYIGSLEQPAAIRSGNRLSLKAPEIIGNKINSQGWEISSNNYEWYRFYPDTVLDSNYNGHYLRYYVSVGGKTYYSNCVRIVVADMIKGKKTVIVMDDFSCDTYYTDSDTFDVSELGGSYYSIMTFADGMVPRYQTVHTGTAEMADIRLAVPGDIDMSGDINYMDISALISMINGETDMNSYIRSVADVDRSGSLDYLDLSLLISFINMETTFKAPF